MFKGDTLVACVDATVTCELLDKVAHALATLDAGTVKKLSREPTMSAGLVEAVGGGTPALVADDLRTMIEGGHTLLADALEKHRKGSAELLRITGKPIDVPKPCAEQFAARRPTGTCSTSFDSALEKDGGAPITVSLVTRFYGLGDNDGAMRRCLAAKSAWTEAP